MRGGKRLLQAAAASLATRLQLTGWVENWAEAKYKALFAAMDLTRDFYFSYTYDLTNTLQTNMVGVAAEDGDDGGAGAGAGGAPATTPMGVARRWRPPPRRPSGGHRRRRRRATARLVDGRSGGRRRRRVERAPRPRPRDKFIWNHHLAYGLFRCVSHPGWAPPIAHGFFLQLSASLFGRLLTLTLIGRRSRLYAGARLLKRGLCEAGHVANEVEVEQIVADGVRGSLHEGGMTSAVQLRGSIPLTWGHGEQQRHMVPRPDIHLQSIDPTYTYTLRHFTDVHQRYGGPIFVFDLIRQAERRWREKILGRGLADALASLHDRMRREGHPLREGGVRYVPFDFKKESKRKGGDVLQAVENLAGEMIRETGFFSSLPIPSAEPHAMHGHPPDASRDAADAGGFHLPAAAPARPRPRWRPRPAWRRACPTRR